MGEVFGADVPLSDYFDEETVSSPELFPTHSTLVESGGSKVVVDPSDFKRLVSPGHFSAPDGYRPPPPLADQLRSVGVGPEEVAQVVITHLHYDHFAGVTTGSGLAFPQATCFVPKADWQMPDIAQGREKGDPEITTTLGLVQKSGKLELLEGALKLGGGMFIEPFEGESPGHQVLGVKSNGESCYCVGDLYHFVEEVEHPELCASWTDAKVLLSSRRKFSKRAASEGALVLPGHLPAGRITFRNSRPVWSAVE